MSPTPHFAGRKASPGATAFLNTQLFINNDIANQGTSIPTFKLGSKILVIAYPSLP